MCDQISKKEKHLNKERLCYHCDTLQESKDNILRFTIKDRGYGSIFDGDNFTIQLCPECAKKLKINEKWFNNEITIVLDTTNDIVDEYVGEINIDKIIDTFPIENQEYIRNCENSLVPYIHMDREEWIKHTKQGDMNEYIADMFGMALNGSEC